MHAGKTLRWPGATPPWPAFSRPKFGGVAPARPEQLGTVFCPRACRVVTELIAQSKRSEAERGENLNASSESTTKTTKNHSRPVTAR